MPKQSTPTKSTDSRSAIKGKRQGRKPCSCGGKKGHRTDCPIMQFAAKG